MIVLRQKTYSIFQELYHSGAKRVKKKYLGRLRRGIADKAGQIARDQAAKNIKLVRNIESGKVEDISNPELARKLVKAGREKGDVRVFDNDKLSKGLGNPLGSQYNRRVVPDEVPGFKDQYENGNFSRQNRKILNSLINRKNIINLSGDYKNSVAVLAHEIGHAMNNTGGAGKKRSVIFRLNHLNRRKSSTDDVIDNIKRELVSYKEESNAWDNGLKLLKENGATKKEVEIAKKNRDAALGTYESNSLSKIGNKIFKKYSPDGMNKKIGIRPNSVSEDKGNIFDVLNERFGNNIPDDEIVDLVNNMKTDRQLYRQQKLRKARRKDKSIMREIFGNW